MTRALRFSLLLVLAAMLAAGCYPHMAQMDRDLAMVKTRQSELEKRVYQLETRVSDLKAKNQEQLKRLRQEVKEVEAALKEFVAAMKYEVGQSRPERADRKRALQKKRDEFVDKNLDKTFGILEKILDRLEREIDKSLEEPR